LQTKTHKNPIMSSETVSSSTPCAFNEKTHFKVVIIGDGGVGKTTYINRHITGQFNPKYTATLGCSVQQLHFKYLSFPESKPKDVIFNIWDCAGQEKFYGLGKDYYANADFAIVMFDVTAKNTFANVGHWISDFQSVCPTSPIIVCGNKVDIAKRVVQHRLITNVLSAFANITYYDISVKSNYNLTNPFLQMIISFTGNMFITFAPESKAEIVTTSLIDQAKTETERAELENKCKQYVAKVECTFAQGLCTIQHLDALITKGEDLLDQIDVFKSLSLSKQLQC